MGKIAGLTKNAIRKRWRKLELIYWEGHDIRRLPPSYFGLSQKELDQLWERVSGDSEGWVCMCGRAEIGEEMARRIEAHDFLPFERGVMLESRR